MFCGDYTHGSSSNQTAITCTFYYNDTNEYADVLGVKSFQMGSTTTFTAQIGDSSDSFCGYVKKFLFFSNTSSFQLPEYSQSTTCPLSLGTLQPICLSTYVGQEPLCGVGQYVKSGGCSSKSLLFSDS